MISKFSRFSTAAVMPLLLAAALSCAPDERGQETATEGGAQGPIRIGWYGALTGPTATFGVATRDGVFFAAEQINAAGGLLGRQVRIIAEDDQGRPEESAQVVTKLITSDEVVAVIGQNTSGNSLAAAPIAQANETPMVSPSSTNPDVTKKGNYIFRACFTDPLQGKALADFTKKTLGLSRVAVFVDVKSDYSVGLAKVFEDRLRELGGTVVSKQSYAAGDNDFRSQLTTIRAAGPQAIFIPGYYTDAGQIAIQARDLGLRVPLIGGDGWESPKLLEIGGAALDGSFYAATVSLASPDPAVQKFVQEWKARRKSDPEGLNALGYDSLMLVAEAIRNAKSVEGPAVRDQLAAIQNFAGASGTISFGPDRDPIKPVPIVEIRDGKAVFRTQVVPEIASR